MSLSNVSVLNGATIAPSGGTALAFSGTGIKNGNSHTLICDADDDYQTRRTIVCTVKEPKYSATAPGGLTQARASQVWKFPKILDNGNLTVETVRIEVSHDPESTVAEVEAHLDLASQGLTDSDFRDQLTRGMLG